MIRLRLYRTFASYPAVQEEILKDSSKKWGDEEEFLKRLFAQTKIAALAFEEGKIVAFSLAGETSIPKARAVLFLATRVAASHRKKGIASQLIKKISFYFLRKKIFLPLNWLKEFYLVSVTANPLVFAGICRRLHTVPSPEFPQPKPEEKDLAEKFSRLFAPGFYFDKEKFILTHAFLNSAEYYAQAESVPWSGNKEIDMFLNQRLKLEKHAGDGLVFVSRIF